MVLMIRGKTFWRALIAFHILCLVSYSTLTAQENRTAVADTLVLSLDDMIRLAYDESSNVLYLVALSKAGDSYLGRIFLDK